MKLLDPFQGYKIASGNIYMSLAYFLQISYILWWQLKGDFFVLNNSLFTMMIVHSSSFILFCSRLLLTEFRKQQVLVPQLMEIACVIMYQGAIFYIQIVYVNLDKTRPSNSLGETWILVELITYYAQLLQAIIFLAYSSLVKPLKPTRSMKKILSKRHDHDYLLSTQDIFQVLNYEGTLIMASFGILQVEIKCDEGQSYQNALYWFIGAISAQLLMNLCSRFVKKESKQKDWVIKICAAVTTVITLYLLFYFLFNEGCDDLIKFWVLGNLVISIFFTLLRVCYILATEGKEGLKKAIIKKRTEEKSSLLTSIEQKKNTFKLGEDFYSIAFYSYIVMQFHNNQYFSEEVPLILQIDGDVLNAQEESRNHSLTKTNVQEVAEQNDTAALVQQLSDSMTEEEVGRTFINSAFIFLIQMVLVLYALIQIFGQDKFVQA